MNLGDQRTSRIKHAQSAFGSFGYNYFGDAMSRKYHYISRRDFIQFFDENSTFVTQVIDHIGVMHDVVADIDWCAKFG